VSIEKPVEPRLYTHITRVDFVAPIPMMDSPSTVIVGRHVSSVHCGRLLPDGSPIVVEREQRSEGLLLRRNSTTPAGKVTQQYFVPWSNISGVTFGE